MHGKKKKSLELLKIWAFINKIVPAHIRHANARRYFPPHSSWRMPNLGPVGAGYCLGKQHFMRKISILFSYHCPLIEIKWMDR